MLSRGFPNFWIFKFPLFGRLEAILTHFKKEKSTNNSKGEKMQALPNANIERAVLSAILFEPALLDSIHLQAKDFYHQAHQDIFRAIKNLESQKKPIDDEFLKIEMSQEGTFDEIVMLDVLSANPIPNINAYLKAMKDATYSAHFEFELRNIIGNERLISTQKSEKIKSLTEKFENSVTEVEPITAKSLIDTPFEELPRYVTGVDFLDDIFDGFELGQLVTITGQQETGKTQLATQILLNIINTHKALLFSLEFNRRKLRNYLLKKSVHALHNLFTVTQDMVSGEIDQLIYIIRQSYHKNDTKFVLIDSQIMLFDESKKFNTSEEEITSFYRKLHKIANDLDILVFIIGTKSISSTITKSKAIEIFGSKKASHYADIQIDISFVDSENMDNSNRVIWVGKNKQNGIHKEIEVSFDSRLLLFEQAQKKQSQTREYSPKNRSSFNITILEDEEVETKEERVTIEQMKRKGFSFDE